MNKLAATTLDLAGGSSYLWHWKHNILHHTYINVAGHDSDIDHPEMRGPDEGNVRFRHPAHEDNSATAVIEGGRS